HHTRPAIDPLFRSAADRYGSRGVGVLLSGMGSGGASGLIAIKKAGGVSLVQHPGEARFGRVPRPAIPQHDVDAMLPLHPLGSTLGALAGGEVVGASRPIVSPCLRSEAEPRLGPMARAIRITAGQVSAVAQLNDSKTANAIWDALPLEAKAETWGDEIYFGIP